MIDKAKEQTKLLTARGVGKKYHKMSLADYPSDTAKEVIDWIASEEYKNGQGALFIGDTADMYDIAILAARGLILSGLPKLEVVNFQHICDMDVLEVYAANRNPLLVTYFEPVEDCIDPLEYKKLEAYLNQLLDDNIPVLLHFPVGKNDNRDGFDNVVFGSRLENNNKLFVNN